MARNHEHVFIGCDVDDALRFTLAVVASLQALSDLIPEYNRHEAQPIFDRLFELAPRVHAMQASRCAEAN